jgi:SAM-dependent methyltransferase
VNDDARPLSRPRATAIARAFLPAHPLGNRWHHYYAREKLASDPLYPGVLRALQGCDAPLLDIGCGIGLLAHALRGDGRAMAYRGVDIDAGKILRARRAAAKAGLAGVEFERIDLAQGLPAHRGSVAILDVLQYLAADAQQRLLDDAIAMLAPGARLVIRAALHDDGRRGRVTRITDAFGHLVGWMQSKPKSYPRLDALHRTFTDAALDAHFEPLYGRTPFNHWLIVARRS